MRVSKKCNYVMFPNHPQRRFRAPCDFLLMKSVISITGKKNFVYPNAVYCYRSIKTSLQELLQRTDFISMIHKGPKQDPDGNFTDICDGNFYKSFKDSNNILYFSDKRNLGGIINIDWFNPFKNQEYSLGVIYMAFSNLPRQFRFKWENVIVLSVIPGPKEPKLNINSYLQPIVKELQLFWKGVLLLENDRYCIYKVAIICVTSDIPATRKICGFKGHNAIKGIKSLACCF